MGFFQMGRQLALSFVHTLCLYHQSSVHLKDFSRLAARALPPRAMTKRHHDMHNPLYVVVAVSGPPEPEPGEVVHLAVTPRDPVNEMLSSSWGAMCEVFHSICGVLIPVGTTSQHVTQFQCTVHDLCLLPSTHA
jgi:hypothetical protein